MYEKALEKKRDDLDPIVVRNMREANTFYQSIVKREPKYLSQFKIRDEFDDGTTYVDSIVIVPRDEPMYDDSSDQATA